MYAIVFANCFETNEIIIRIMRRVQNSKVTVNDFLDTLMSDPGPHCLIWLPLYHRMAAVETGSDAGFKVSRLKLIINRRSRNLPCF